VATMIAPGIQTTAPIASAVGRSGGLRSGSVGSVSGGGRGVPVGSPSGSGAGAAAGGGSGLFFFGAAVLFALSALFVPRGIGALRRFGRSLAPEPFVVLLERPG
jgi:hypothetical protein